MQLWKRIKKIASGAFVSHTNEVILTPLLGEFFEEFADMTFPEKRDKIPRDIFDILIVWWARCATTGEDQNTFEALDKIRKLAELGYNDLPGLINLANTTLPDIEFRQKVILYFSEIGERSSHYLFLPIAARIRRHQATPTSFAKLSEVEILLQDSAGGQLATSAFAEFPDAKRQRSVFLYALLTLSWDNVQVFTSNQTIFQSVRAQLVLLLTMPVT